MGETNPLNGIRGQMILLMLTLSIVPLSVVTWIAYQNAKDSLRSAYEYQLLEESQSIKSFINNWFDYRWMDINRESNNAKNSQLLLRLDHQLEQSALPLDTFVKSSRWYETINRQDEHLKSLLVQYDYIYDIFLINPQGDILYTVEHEVDFGTNLFTGPFAQTRFAAIAKQTLKTGETLFSDFERYEPSNGLLSGFASSPLLDDQGSIIGIFAMQFWVERLQNQLLNRDNSYLRAYIVGTDQRLRTPLKGHPSEPLRSTIDLSAIQTLPLDQVGIYRSADGNQYLAVHHKLNIWNITWTLICEIPIEYAFSSTRQLAQIAVTTGLITFLIAVLFSVLASNKITNPILALVASAQKILDGEKIRHIKVKSENEVGLLADSINKMLDHQDKVESSLVHEKERAIESSKAKSQFLANMSHEIRTPMNGVLGMMGLLKRSITDEEQKKKLDIAYSSAKSLLAIIDDILDFSKIESGKLNIEKSTVNIARLLHESAISFAFRIEEKGLELVVDDTQIDAPNLIGDSVRINQVINNLVGNAIKFTHKGSIKILASTRSLNDNTILFTCEVQDSGIGIPENRLESLFESFTQADNSTTRKYGGTGLGLAISKALAKAMEGDILIQSKVGIGSTFTFQCKMGIDLGHQDNKFVELNSQCVWIIDNDWDTQRILCNIFNKSKASVVNVALLADIPSNAPHPNLIVVELQQFEEALALIENLSLADSHPFNIIVIQPSVLHATQQPQSENISFVNKPITSYGITYAVNRLLKPSSTDQQSLINNSQSALSLQAKLNVLVVEDNKVNQEVALNLMQEFGLPCTLAENGREAIEKLKSSPPNNPISLVLMDCQMPIMDGYLATQYIREGQAGESYKSVPIIAMTANAMRGDRQACFDAGMDDYLSKPIDDEHLLQALQKWSKHIIKPEPIGQGNDANDTVPLNLDTFEFAKLSPRLLNPPTRFTRLLASFFHRNLITELDNCIAKNDFETLANILHSTKGSAGNLGMMKLYQKCNDLESQAKQKRISKETVNTFKDAYQSTKSQAQEVISYYNGTPS